MPSLCAHIFPEKNRKSCFISGESSAQGSPSTGANQSQYLPVRNPAIAPKHLFGQIHLGFHRFIAPTPRDISGREPMDRRRACFTLSLSDPFLPAPHPYPRMLRTSCSSHSTNPDCNSLGLIPPMGPEGPFFSRKATTIQPGRWASRQELETPTRRFSAIRY
jgi:hypothetical protein